MSNVRKTISRILLTRFNVRIGAVANPKVTSTHWLAERMHLFRHVTVASIRSQRVQPDRWFVFFDVATPEATRREIAQLQREVPILAPVFCEGLGADVYLTAVRSWLPSSTEWLISTRIDNDDALHPNALASVYESAEIGRKEFINPLRGLVVSGGKAFRKRDYSSPFISLSEPSHAFSTVWVGQHHKLRNFGSVRQIAAKDLWIQVVHGGNLANQVRGVRAPIARIDGDTLPPTLAAQLLDDGWVALALDNSIGLVNRYVRSAVRRAKRVLLDR
jgi:hypothetical protein